MSDTRPSFQFYPGDWWRDKGLRMCSLEARGLWIDMLCIMHDAEPYGYLMVGPTQIPPKKIGGLVGVHTNKATKLLGELLQNNVVGITEDGTLYSRRMVRDEKARKARAAEGFKGAEHGKKGAEHGLKGGRPRGVTRGVLANNEKPPPSSSSSSSLHKKESGKEKSSGSRLTIKALPDDWREWCSANTPHLNPDKVFDKFHDHWSAKPGKDGRKSDWLATWRNWCRAERSPETRINGHGNGAGSGKPMTFAQREAELWDRQRHPERYGNGNSEVIEQQMRELENLRIGGGDDVDR